jgi:hypothetical protein
MFPVHEITVDKHGNQIGTDGEITVTLMDGGRMFKRRAIKGVGTDAAEEVCWLVAELDGVRVFQHGRNIVVTKRDMNP